jgi:hypothetical protein
MDEYLTIQEVAEKLKVKPKTIKNKMALGIFQQGIHYFSPKGLGPRFKWSAVIAWLEQTQEATTVSDGDSIPMPRSYRLREPWTKKGSIKPLTR